MNESDHRRQHDAHPALAGLTHPDKDVRQQTAIALGSRADPLLTPAVASLLWGESDFFVRETLTWVLTRTPTAAVDAATQALTDPDPAVRTQALHVLSKIKHPDSAAAVTACLDDQDTAVAERARWALARIGDPSVLPVLITRLGQADLAGRDSLTSTLAQFGASAVPPLVTALTDSNPSVRMHAADVLCYIGSPHTAEATPELVNALDDADPDVRLSAVMALRELTDHRDARAAMAQAITHDDPRVAGVARASV